jgi:hypothetical protein
MPDVRYISAPKLGAFAPRRFLECIVHRRSVQAQRSVLFSKAVEKDMLQKIDCRKTTCN